MPSPPITATGSFNVFANYSNNISKNKNNGIIERPENNSKQLFKFNDNSKSHLVKFGVDYYINDKHTLSIFTNQNTSNSKNNGESNAIYANESSLTKPNFGLMTAIDSTSSIQF